MLFLVSTSHHPNAFFILSPLFYLFSLYYLLIDSLFFPPLLFHLHITCARVCAHVIFEDSSWTDHCAPFFLQSLSPSCLSLRLSPSLSGRLQRNWSLGGSREEPGKGGTKGRPSAAITTPHLLCSPRPHHHHHRPSRPSLPRSPRSVPCPHWPAPQIKTSDKKMGSLKKGKRVRERGRE